jgi:hypothetical protein
MFEEDCKKVPWFSHDSNSRSDDKILPLRMKLGWEGYGIFWAIIEMLRECNGYKMQMQCECIAYELHADMRKVECIINDFNLFEIDRETNFFWSNSLIKRMKIKDATSEKNRNAAKKRWENQGVNADAMRAHSECNAEAMLSKVKISKEKNKKESKIKLINSNLKNKLERDKGDSPKEGECFAPPQTPKSLSVKKRVGRKEKLQREGKKQFGEFVWLSQEESKDLEEILGGRETLRCIGKINKWAKESEDNEKKIKKVRDFRERILRWSRESKEADRIPKLMLAGKADESDRIYTPGSFQDMMKQRGMQK